VASAAAFFIVEQRCQSLDVCGMLMPKRAVSEPIKISNLSMKNRIQIVE
jgi:hypothetical protein